MARIPTLFFVMLLSCQILCAEGWEIGYPRQEIAPDFLQIDEALGIHATGNEGVMGFWHKTVPVKGGEWVQFSATYESKDVEHPRRSILARVIFQGAKGELVPREEPTVMHYFQQTNPPLERPRFPGTETVLADGRTHLEGRYPVPPLATQAVIELHLRWAPHGQVTWTDVSLTPCEPMPERKVKLAAAHISPKGGESPLDNVKFCAPVIAEAAAKGADLICLPECITVKGLRIDYADAAETIPGPSTDYLGTLAKEHDIYIVAGLIERAEPLIYNVAVLIGPEGKVEGTYRKVTLPREEIAKGISPGEEYPVFETRFGKLGMMVCYDVFYPEVARKLARNGAEVIAMPIWGGNPLLASARACENHVFLVTSTYTDPAHEWMKSGVWDREGQLMQHATEWGTVMVQEVDLNQPTVWRHLGDFQSRIFREAPVWGE